MHELPFLTDLLLLTALALATAWLSSRLRQSPIIGYLLTGMLVGPYGFHLIRNIGEVGSMAELGVILLLFSIGLEFSFSRILRLKGLLIRCGLTQLILTCLTLFCGLKLFGISTTTAATLAMALSLSSTAMVLKLLSERGSTDSAQGRISLAILLAQDLCVILFLVALPLLSGKSGQVSPVGFIKALLLLGGLVLFSRKMLHPLLRGILATRTPELFRLLILLLALGTAWLTHQAGLSLALGAFLAGLALAESDYSHQVLADIIPFRDTFLAIFFISVGMLVDVSLFASHFNLILGGLLLLGLIKIVTATIAARTSGYPLQTALLAGLALFQVGEFSFLLLEEAMDLNLLSTTAYQVTLAIIALSLMVTPPVFAHAEQLAGLVCRLLRREKTPEVEAHRERLGNLAGHVIIAGYGVSGQNCGHLLRQTQIPYLFVEINGGAVEKARKSGEYITFGDATSPMVLEAIGIHRARAMIISINDPSALHRAVKAARETNPELLILARSRFILEDAPLRQLGADHVIIDEFEASLQLGAALLRQLGMAEGKTLKLVNDLRQQQSGGLPHHGSNLAGYLSVLESGQLDFQAVPDTSPCLGKTLAQLDFRAGTGCTAIGLIRDEKTSYTVTGELQLMQGDTLLLLGQPEDLERGRLFLHGQS